jgi:hypothetical protein
VNAGSSNTVEIFANLGMNETESILPQYAFAVEIVGLKLHNDILQECESRLIPSADSLEAIRNKLKGQTSGKGGEDDVIIKDARSNITIYDPICQGKICEIPARGQDCKHTECFDLEIFLQARPREKPHHPSDADSWKCPICLKDVRPDRIVVDGFLKDVRDKLIMDGKARTRVITVDADGTWTPKEEEEMDSARSTPDFDAAATKGASEPAVAAMNAPLTRPSYPLLPEAGATRLSVPPAQESRQMIVIDLSNDD